MHLGLSFIFCLPLSFCAAFGVISSDLPFRSLILCSALSNLFDTSIELLFQWLSFSFLQSPICFFLQIRLLSFKNILSFLYGLYFFFIFSCILNIIILKSLSDCGMFLECLTSLIQTLTFPNGMSFPMWFVIFFFIVCTTSKGILLWECCCSGAHSSRIGLYFLFLVLHEFHWPEPIFTLVFQLGNSNSGNSGTIVTYGLGPEPLFITEAFFLFRFIQCYLLALLLEPQ